jgi:hypothetical protein
LTIRSKAESQGEKKKAKKRDLKKVMGSGWLDLNHSAGLFSYGFNSDVLYELFILL